MGAGGQNPFGSEIPLGYLADGQKMAGKLNFASDATVLLLQGGRKVRYRS